MPKIPGVEYTSPRRSTKGYYTVPKAGKYGEPVKVTPEHYKFLEQLYESAVKMDALGYKGVKELAESWTGAEYKEKAFGKGIGLEDIFQEMEDVLKENAEKIGKSLHSLESDFIRSGKTLKDFISTLDKSSKQMDKSSQIMISSLLTIAGRTSMQLIGAGGGGIYGGGTGTQQVNALANLVSSLAPIIAAISNTPWIGAILGVGAGAMSVAGEMGARYINLYRSAYPLIGKGIIGPTGLGETLGGATKYGFTPTDMATFMTGLVNVMGGIGMQTGAGTLAGLTTLGLTREEITNLGGVVRRAGRLTGVEAAETTMSVVARGMGNLDVLHLDLQQVSNMISYVNNTLGTGVDVKNIASFYRIFKDALDTSKVNMSMEDLTKSLIQIGGGLMRPRTPAMEAFLFQTLGAGAGIENYISFRQRLENILANPKDFIDIMQKMWSYTGNNQALMTMIMTSQFGMSFTQARDILGILTSSPGNLKEREQKLKEYFDEAKKKEEMQVIINRKAAQIPEMLTKYLPDIDKQMINIGENTKEMNKVMVKIQDLILKAINEVFGDKKESSQRHLRIHGAFGGIEDINPPNIQTESEEDVKVETNVKVKVNKKRRGEKIIHKSSKK